MDPREGEAMNPEDLTPNKRTFDNPRLRKLPILRRLSYFVKINLISEDPSSFDPLGQLIHPLTVERNAVNLSFAILSEINF